MKVRFFGPLGRVTGSCALLHDDQLNVRILIDAGLQQGEAEQESWNRGALPFDTKSLTHIVLTHAHIDHCGLLPRIVKAGFRGEVICTPETAALAKLELQDCARIGRDYTCADVAKVRFAPKDVPFGAHFPIARDVFLQFFRTAHILGAVAVRVCWGKRGPNQRSILFSGDLGSNVDTDERFLFLRHRMEPPPSTFAVVESTYGDRKRDDGSESFQGRIDGLRTELASARERGGQTLIASFSMDRLQTLLLDLAYLCARDTDLARTPILVHTPLGEKISRVYAEFVSKKDQCPGGVRPRWLSKSAFRHLGLTRESAAHERALEASIRAVFDPDAERAGPLAGLNPVHRWVRERKTLDQHHIVIASSGMLEGGAALSYLPDLLVNASSTLLLSGYAMPNSVAGRLSQLGGLPLHERQRLAGDCIDLRNGTKVLSSDVRAHIGYVKGYSAHADQKGLLDWLVYEHSEQTCLAARTLFIQHGHDGARAALQRELSSIAPEIRTLCPTPDEATYDLEMAPPESRGELERRIAELEARLAAATKSAN